MKRTLLSLAVLVVFVRVYATNDLSFQQVSVHLPDSLEAATLTGQSDAYTKSFSKFDLQSRLQTMDKASENNYLLNAARQVRNWEEEDVAIIERSLKLIDSFLQSNNIKLDLPPRINIIRTTCLEEFGAEGYTRGNNIYLSTLHEGTVKVHTVAHELFHVFSRYNPAVRDKLYAVFGFQPCNVIDMRKALEERNVSNPDCPEIAHYVPVSTDAGIRDLVIILYSKRPYQGGGNIMETYLSLDLMELTGGREKNVMIKDGKPVILKFEDVPQIFEKIGTNTTYILHPEEVCAEHFAMMITGKKVPQPEYIERVVAVLKN